MRPQAPKRRRQSTGRRSTKFWKVFRKKAGVLISHLPRDLFHRKVREFEKSTNLLHLQMLHLLGGRKTGRLLKSPQKGSLAKLCLSRHPFDCERFRRDCLKPELNPQKQHIPAESTTLTFRMVSGFESFGPLTQVRPPLFGVCSQGR